MKTYRFVTTKGSVTIPFDIRIREGWNTGTLVSFEKQKDGALLLRKESICDCGKNNLPFFAVCQKSYVKVTQMKWAGFPIGIRPAFNCNILINNAITANRAD